MLADTIEQPTEQAASCSVKLSDRLLAWFAAHAAELVTVQRLRDEGFNVSPRVLLAQLYDLVNADKLARVAPGVYKLGDAEIRANIYTTERVLALDDGRRTQVQIAKELDISCGHVCKILRANGRYRNSTRTSPRPRAVQGPDPGYVDEAERLGKRRRARLIYDTQRALGIMHDRAAPDVLPRVSVLSKATARDLWNMNVRCRPAKSVGSGLATQRAAWGERG